MHILWFCGCGCSWDSKASKLIRKYSTRTTSPLLSLKIMVRIVQASKLVIWNFAIYFSQTKLRRSVYLLIIYQLWKWSANLCQKPIKWELFKSSVSWLWDINLFRPKMLGQQERDGKNVSWWKTVNYSTWPVLLMNKSKTNYSIVWALLEDPTNTYSTQYRGFGWCIPPPVSIQRRDLAHITMTIRKYDRFD